MEVKLASTPTGRPGHLRTVGLVGVAHFTSHFLMLALAPLLPLMKAEFGVSFTQLGYIITLFFGASAAGQVLAGMLVDRVGPHRMLVSGVLLQGLAIGAMGLVPTIGLIFPLAVVAGLGNTVYHPSDLSILSRRVARKWQGRAFATHATAGAFGFAASPIAIGLAGAWWGWRAALVVTGILAFLVGIGLLLSRSWLRADEHDQLDSWDGKPDAAPRKLTFAEMITLPSVRFGFCFFVLLALAGTSIMNFTISALTLGYGVTLASATIAIAAYQFGAIGGTLGGGFVADRWPFPHRIAIACVIASGLCALPVIYTGLPLALIAMFLALSGVFAGATLPSRDLLIRQSAPPGNLGKTFGMVYSGLDCGSLIGPLVVGPMLDHGLPQSLFFIAALAMCLAALTIVRIRGAGKELTSR